MSILIKKKVIHFDIIHHECSDDSLKKSYQEHKPVKKLDFNEFPEDEKTKTVSSVIRNIKRHDLWVQINLMTEHFFKKFRLLIIFWCLYLYILFFNRKK